ncbi:hypothetical protein CY35_03G059400 [Sphagnum magellanicum]|nr:hypothetical protein CY35_03G059400 [Sphagnum magellanicum]
MHENRLFLRGLLSITLPFSSSSCFLHNAYSLPLASSSSDAAEQTCVVDSGRHPKRTSEGAAAAAFPVVEFCNSVRKKRKQGLGSELLQISREPWSIVGRLQLWNTRTSTSSVADLQRDHRTIDCLPLTDSEISICCSVASLHPQFLGQLAQLVLQFADMLLSSAAVLWKQQLQKDPSNCSQAVATQMCLKSMWERAR